QPQNAMDRWIAGIRFAQDLAKGGSLIYALTAKSALMQEARVLTEEARQGRLSSAQKTQLYMAVKALPEDGLDWSLTWKMEEAASEPFFAEMQRSQNPAELYESLMGMPAPKDCVPPNAQQVHAYHDYMGAVADALRLPPSTSKRQLAELDGKARSVCEAIRRT